jgi:hypothetical protein
MFSDDRCPNCRYSPSGAPEQQTSDELPQEYAAIYEKTKSAFDSETPFDQIIQHFSDKPSAMKFYARIVGKRYAPTSIKNVCSVCDRGCNEGDLSVCKWFARFDTFTNVGFGLVFGRLAGLFPEGANTVEFDTHHNFCPGCFSQLRRSHYLTESSYALGKVFLSLSLMAIMGVSMLYFAGRNWTPEEISWFARIGLGGALVLVASALMLGYGQRNPEALRAIGKKPFMLRSVKRMRKRAS